MSHSSWGSASGDEPKSQARQLADRLGEIRPDLINAYRQALVRQCNPLGVNQEAWITCREQAEQIIADCLGVLREEREPLLDVGVYLKARRLGGARISQGIGPIHSVRAASVLFQIVMDQLGRVATEFPGCERHLMKALLALQSSIIRRLEQGAIGHDLFLLDVVRDAAQQGRNSMAREIHDRIGSAASVALRQLELYELTQNGDVRTDVRLAALKQAIQETQYITRDLVSELRTRLDTTRSLQVALSSFVTAMALDKPVVEIAVDDPDDRLPPRIADDLYLMLRECLRNAFAHASASRIDIALAFDHDLVRASVRDDGVGFDPERRTGHGLASLVERSRLLGATLTITSALGEGTTVELCVPVGKEDHGGAE
ncbi:sensor histidine kinase [Streptomyces griseochromogenes]|uniref:sensor histidine kinase n=1 Tax=Streptomyces griseochromogenes TaxID=68214 RepID=UPI0037B7D82D